jgi:peptidyl-prolyl cis-trans isomerase SurA
MKTLAAFGLLLTLSFGAVATAQEPVTIDETIARVNRDLITRSMLVRAEKGLMRELEGQYPNEPEKVKTEFERLRKRLVGSLVDERLIAQKAEELGVNAEVESQVNAILIDICKQNGVENLSACQALMERQGITVEEVKASYRAQLQRQAVYGQDVYQSVIEKVTVKEAEEFYKQHVKEFTEPGEIEISEIFIPFTGETILQAENRAKQAVNEIAGGKPFADVARAFSDPKRPSTANGGKLPPYRDDQINPILKEQIDKIQPGQLTPILKTDKGYQILKLEARRPPAAKPFEEVKDVVKRAIAQQRAGAKVAEYMKSLRQRALIQLADPYRNALLEEEKPEPAAPEKP